MQSFRYWFGSVILQPEMPVATSIIQLREDANERDFMRKKIGVTVAMLLGVTFPCWADVSVDRLRCEYLHNPLGIDVTTPRLSWVLQSQQRGQKQTAYQVLIATTVEMLAKDQGNLWDSGCVASDQSIHIEYAGKPLCSRAPCHWKVRVWDKDKQPSPWSKPAMWTMGLLAPKDWQAAQWIGAAVDRPERTKEQRAGLGSAQANDLPYAAVLLRKEIAVSKLPARATACVCGLGYCEVSINGKKIGDHKLDPAFTDYTKRILYSTYDVTELLRSGRNAIGATLGAGWYDSPTIDDWQFHRAPWIAPPKLLLCVDIDYVDGTHESIVSDGTWKESTGPIVFNSIRGGETYDARREKHGWDQPGYDDAEWANAHIVPPPQGRLMAQMHPPIRAIQSLRPVALDEPKPGVYVFDLGANIAGWAQLRTSGSQGQVITLEFNELRKPDGTVNMAHLADSRSGRFQTEQFILKGGGVETYEPRFTYHGFRYVQVTGLTEKPTVDSLIGRWVHTDLELAGKFSCSNPLINKIQDAIVRTQLNNVHGFPTDCPQREKIGWTEDGCVTVEEAICNFNMAMFYTKWFRDILDAQDANGHVACIAPSPGWGRSLPDGSPGVLSDPWWGGAVVRVPWQLYRYYGDRRILIEGYDAMTKYLDYVGRHAPNHIAWAQEGDWVEVGARGQSLRTPPNLASTTAYCHYAKIVGHIAALLGKTAEAKRYDDLAEAISRSFHQQYFDPVTGLYAKDSQTAQALPLCFGMPPANKRPLVLEQLVRNIQETRKNHISSGIVGTLYVFQALMESGRDDLAYAMVAQEDFPSWGHMLGRDGSTIWENWNGSGSQNHPALGSIGVWFYQALAGIRPDPTIPGFRHIIIKPAVVGDLTWARAHYDSIHGEIVSDWKREGGVFLLRIVVPATATATVFVPANDAVVVTESGSPASAAPGVRFLRMEDGAAVFNVESGQYIFRVENPR